MDPKNELKQDQAGTCSEHELNQIRKNMIDEHIAVEAADWFKAFGDVTRLKLISLLLQKELNVTDLSALTGMNQSAISHQLRYLRDMRIVKRRKAGKTAFYSLDDSHVEQILAQTLIHIAHNHGTLEAEEE